MQTSGRVRLCVLGATGLIGSSFVAQARRSDGLEVVSLSRRLFNEQGFSEGDACGRIEHWVGPVETWPTLLTSAYLGQPFKVLVCALGTTVKAAGSREEFCAVDYELVCRMAETARLAGVSHMIFISSIGANPKSRNFYLSVKGRAERELAELGFARLDILRPSLLRGKRPQSRVMEDVG